MLLANLTDRLGCLLLLRNLSFGKLSFSYLYTCMSIRSLSLMVHTITKQALTMTRVGYMQTRQSLIAVFK